MTHEVWTQPPAPKDPWEVTRITETRRRRRMLEGTWGEDIKERMRQELGGTRSQYQGEPDRSANVFASVCSQLAVSYDREPRLEHEVEGAAERMTELLRGAGYTSLMQRLQRDTLGLREMLLRVHVVTPTDRPPELVLRPVSPDYVVAGPNPHNPRMPAWVEEAVWRRVDGRDVWVWERWAVSGDKVAVACRLDSDPRQDVTAAVYAEGVPPYFQGETGAVLPYVLYHASDTATLWDPWYGIELVEATLQSALHYSHFAHGMLHASWPQRYTIGATLAGDVEPDAGEAAPRREVPVSPTVVLHFVKAEGYDGQPLVSQWSAGCDPDKIFDSAVSYERRAGAQGGMSGSDVLRLDGDPRSGYALLISNESKRTAAAKFEPVFERSDLQLLRTIAIAMNAAGLDPKLPEAGWRIKYVPLPPSADEVKAHREHVLELLDRGLMSKVDAYAAIHNVSKAEAKKALTDLAAAPAASTPPAPGTAPPRPSDPATPPVADPAQPPPPAAVAAPDVALNGAQAAEGRNIVQAVARGELPRASGVAMLQRFFNLTPEAADQIMGPVGNTFKIAPPAPAGAPPSPPT